MTIGKKAIFMGLMGAIAMSLLVTSPARAWENGMNGGDQDQCGCDDGGDNGGNEGSSSSGSSVSSNVSSGPDSGRYDQFDRQYDRGERAVWSTYRQVARYPRKSVRSKIRRSRRTVQRPVMRRTQTSYAVSGWAPGYYCTINGAPVYNRSSCVRVNRLAIKGRGYTFADASGYASYVSISGRQRAVRYVHRKHLVRKPSRRVIRKARKQRVIVYEQAPEVVYERERQVVYVKTRSRVKVRARARTLRRARSAYKYRRATVSGSMRGSGSYYYGTGNAYVDENGGVTVHYGPMIGN